MRRKILDISYPGQEKSEGQMMSREPEQGFRPPKRFRAVKVLFTLIAILLAFGGILWVTSGFYSKLTIELVPSIEKQVFSEEVEINKNQPALDIGNRIIPGRFFTTRVKESKTFPATGKGKAETKASGIITVYNSYIPPRGITLVASTRFLSSDGSKIFKSPKAIYIPPAQSKGGKIIPGSKKITVIAQKAGSDYNIGPSKFSVPGLVGSPLYYTIWAESTVPMSGGSSSEIAVVTAEDLENAKNSLEEELKIKAKQSLAQEMPKTFSADIGSMTIEDFAPVCNANKGDKMDEFECTAEATIKALAYKKEDVDKIAAEIVSREIPSSKNFDRRSMKVKIVPKTLASNSGKMIVELETTVGLYDKVNKDTVPVKIAGVKGDQIKSVIFNSYPSIKKINLIFWPFWAKKAPSDPQRIMAKIIF